MPGCASALLIVLRARLRGITAITAATAPTTAAPEPITATANGSTRHHLYSPPCDLRAISHGEQRPQTGHRGHSPGRIRCVPGPAPVQAESIGPLHESADTVKETARQDVDLGQAQL